MVGWFFPFYRYRLVRSKAIDNPPFFKIVWRHFQSYLVSRKNVDAVHPHPPGEVAEKLMVFRLRAKYSDAKGGIGKRFFDNANELNDILRHRTRSKKGEIPKSQRTLQIGSRLSKP